MFSIVGKCHQFKDESLNCVSFYLWVARLNHQDLPKVMNTSTQGEKKFVNCQNNIMNLSPMSTYNFTSYSFYQPCPKNIEKIYDFHRHVRIKNGLVICNQLGLNVKSNFSSWKIFCQFLAEFFFFFNSAVKFRFVWKYFRNDQKLFWKKCFWVSNALEVLSF